MRAEPLGVLVATLSVALALLASPGCRRAPPPQVQPSGPLALTVDPTVATSGTLPDRSDDAATRRPWQRFRPDMPLAVNFLRPEIQRTMERFRTNFEASLLAEGVIDFQIVHALYKEGLLSRSDRPAQVARLLAWAEARPILPALKAHLVVALAHVGFEYEALELAETYRDEPWFTSSWDANFYVGAILFRMARYDDAVPYLERADALNPEAWSRLWLRLSLAHRPGPEAAARRDGLYTFGPHMGADDPSQFPFVDRSAEWGFGRWALAGSAAFADFDGDTFLDLALTASYHAPELHRFEPGVGLVMRPDSAIDAISHVTPSALAADFDNDGWTDLYLASAAWFGAGTNRLLRNDGGRRFVDLSDRGDAALLDQNSTGLAALDYDRDGLVDIVVSGTQGGSARLLRNRGDFLFEEVTEGAGITARDTVTIHLTAGDVNDDGAPDIFVNSFGDNALYINRGDGTFSDEAAARGVLHGTPTAFCTWMFDFDNDGDLDIAAGNFAILGDEFRGGFGSFPSGHFESARSGTRYFAPSALYENDGTGHFQNIGPEAGFTQASIMGGQFIDLELDGDLDVIWGPGSHPLENMQPLLVYRNDGGGRFTQITPLSNPRYYGKMHGMAFADIDRDGDPDLFVNNGGVMLSDSWRDLLLENTTTDRRWLHLKLEGRQSNRSAIGARVSMQAGARLLMQEVAAGQGFGATNSPYLIFGLDRAASATEIEIRWPSGKIQRVPDLAADQAVVVVEGQPDLRRIY